MQRSPAKSSSVFRWGIPASVAAHVIVVALLVFGLPLPEFSPTEEEPAIEVALVPPPEDVPPEPEIEPEPEPDQQAEADDAAGQPETAEEAETLPEEDAEAESAVSAQAEPEPAPEPEQAPESEASAEEAEQETEQETAVAATVPEIEPAPEPEQAPELEQAPESEQSAPEAEQPLQDNSEQETEETSAAEGSQPLRALRPVFAYGEEDGGPRETGEGSSALSGADDTSALQGESEAPGIVAVPSTGPDADAVSQATRTLNSANDTGAETATTAIMDIPRSQRGADLCATELREQLRRAEPPFWPELIPAYKLGNGTVINVANGAFHAGGQWFELAFRCEVNGEVTRVVSFDIKVGAPIPKDQWRSRGFPDF